MVRDEDTVIVKRCILVHSRFGVGKALGNIRTIVLKLILLVCFRVLDSDSRLNRV